VEEINVSGVVMPMRAFSCRRADEFMCLKYRGICPLVDEVAAVVPACELWGKFQEAIHTEVEGFSNALRGV
jgi:hypothetical protein